MQELDKKLKRNDSVARILVLVSAILVPVGVIVISPVGGVFFLGLAGILSIIAVLASKKYRYIALVLLLVAIAMLSVIYFQTKRHYESYRKFTLEESAKTHDKSPSQQKDQQ